MIYEEILTMLSLGLKLGSKLPSVQTGNLRAIWSKAKHSQAQDRKERITGGLLTASKLYVFISRRSSHRRELSKTSVRDQTWAILASLLIPLKTQDDHFIHPAPQVCSCSGLQLLRSAASWQ